MTDTEIKMTPDELEAWRARMGWTKNDAAKTLDIAPNTYGAYSRGKAPVPGYIALACEALKRRQEAPTGAKLRVAIILNEHGEISSIVSDAPAEIYIVQPNCLRDRVYLYSQDVGPEHIRAAIGGYPIGHAADGTLDVGLPVSPRLPPISARLHVITNDGEAT